MKVLANDGISAKAKAALEAEGITVSTDHVEQADLIDTLNREGYAGILVRSATKVRQDLIDACPDLRFIGRGGV
ncbi:MAG: 3-phosphoglycerate dehydrogenase, partial [Bacteroidota bacterium]|nr:3-phosphoglycerate dehydrogenase [Bacteroidota bacterium]